MGEKPETRLPCQPGATCDVELYPWCIVFESVVGIPLGWFIPGVVPAPGDIEGGPMGEGACGGPIGEGTCGGHTAGDVAWGGGIGDEDCCCRGTIGDITFPELGLWLDIFWNLSLKKNKINNLY